MYTIENQPVGSQTLVLQSTNDFWKREFIGASSGQFIRDNKCVVHKNSDTLLFCALESEACTSISNVQSYKQKGDWLAYHLKNSTLMLRNLQTNKEQGFNLVSDYSFNNNGNTLLLKTSAKHDSASEESLTWIDLKKNTTTNIWSSITIGNSSNISSYSLDESGTQLVFIVKEQVDNRPSNTIWYYKSGMSKSVMLANNHSAGIGAELIIGDWAPSFSSSGNYIFFNMAHKKK